MPFLSDVEIAGHAVNTALLGLLLAALLGWVVVYLVYKTFWHADFGLPVRRRLLVTKLSVQRDQVAFVPLWWSDLQIQRAIGAHWKSKLRTTAGRRPATTARADNRAP